VLYVSLQKYNNMKVLAEFHITFLPFVGRMESPRSAGPVMCAWRVAGMRSGAPQTGMARMSEEGGEPEEEAWTTPPQ
jgi:hypothetical protein